MKKLLIVFVLAAILATGTVFADHPDGLGIGVLWRGNIGFDGHFGSGVALSLHVPNVPIFWGIDLHLGGSSFGIGLTGDKYIYDTSLVPDINLHWYLGLGGFLSFFAGNDASIQFGARLPIGLSWHILEILELFLEVAPSLGVGIYTHGDGGINFPVGGFPVGIGLRLWF